MKGACGKAGGDRGEGEVMVVKVVRLQASRDVVQDRLRL